jgi:hypothetical protein
LKAKLAGVAEMVGGTPVTVSVTGTVSGLLVALAAVIATAPL